MRGINMTEFAFNNQYLMRDGEPWFPVMGEMHYSRFREDLWEESLRKIKAGGLTIVSTYAIWIHHEEEEGIFDFSGQRNLRKFIEIADKVGLDVFLRIGPWVHGEARNGGFPDWLQAQDAEIKLRSDDTQYLEYVRKYWSAIAEEVEGQFHKDGGPIIGIQIENEYGHVGGLRGEEGEQHMRTLQALAIELGMIAPIYTATGWGGAVTGGMLPVMGGYASAPWAQHIDALPANENFIFSDHRNDTSIGSDHNVSEEITFDVGKFPYLTAELGGGNQVTRHRRPVVTGQDTGAMSLAKLGSGVGLLGYYMYHGGSNPDGKLSTLQESRATGELNDLPEINYDFNAPIRQYGTISDAYKEIRLLGQFLADFGSDIATMKSEFPEGTDDPEDTETLRYAIRHNGKRGYLFFNNHQRLREMDAHDGVSIELPVEDGTLTFPSFSIESGEYAFYPYMMELGGATLKYATATPLCSLQTNTGSDAGDTYVFYGSDDAIFEWEEEQADTILISRTDALNAQKLTLDQDYIVITDNYVWTEDDALVVTGAANTEMLVYPELTTVPEGFELTGKDGVFTRYTRELEAADITYGLSEVERSEEVVTYELTVDYKGRALDRVAGQDVILYINYTAESMDLLVDGKKINDYFYTGQEELISLGYLGSPEKLTLKVYPLHKDEEVYLETWPEITGDSIAEIHSIRVEEEYR